MRYGDTPVFLDVSSVISQYQIAGQVNLGAAFNNNPWGSVQTLGGSGTGPGRMWTARRLRTAPLWGINSPAA